LILRHGTSDLIFRWSLVDLKQKTYQKLSTCPEVFEEGYAVMGDRGEFTLFTGTLIKKIEYSMPDADSDSTVNKINIDQNNETEDDTTGNGDHGVIGEPSSTWIEDNQYHEYSEDHLCNDTMAVKKIIDRITEGSETEYATQITRFTTETESEQIMRTNRITSDFESEKGSLFSKPPTFEDTEGNLSSNMIDHSSIYRRQIEGSSITNKYSIDINSIEDCTVIKLSRINSKGYISVDEEDCIDGNSQKSSANSIIKEESIIFDSVDSGSRTTFEVVKHNPPIPKIPFIKNDSSNYKSLIMQPSSESCISLGASTYRDRRICSIQHERPPFVKGQVVMKLVDHYERRIQSEDEEVITIEQNNVSHQDNRVKGSGDIPVYLKNPNASTVHYTPSENKEGIQLKEPDSIAKFVPLQEKRLLTVTNSELETIPCEKCSNCEKYENVLSKRIEKSKNYKQSYRQLLEKYKALKKECSTETLNRARQNWVR